MPFAEFPLAQEVRLRVRSVAQSVQLTKKPHGSSSVLLSALFPMLVCFIPQGLATLLVYAWRCAVAHSCEISVTTGDEWEAHNVQKCLAAGYNEVIVCSSDIKNLQRIREQLENKLTKNQLTKVLTLEPQEVIQYFDKQIVQESSTEKVVKGYRVKVEFDTSTHDEMEKKQESVAKTVTESIKRKKKN